MDTPPPRDPAQQHPPAASSQPAQGRDHAKGLRGRNRRATGVLPALSYGLTGFLLGVAFWHTVGFWQLVSTAVLSGPRNVAAAPPPPMSSAINDYQPATGRHIETGSMTTGSVTTGSMTTGAITTGAISTGAIRQPSGSNQAQPAETQSTKSAATVSGLYPAPPEADTERCSTFMRNAASGEVNSSNCPPDRDLLAEVPAYGREDKAKPLIESGWSTAVRTPVANEVIPPANDLP